MSHKIAGNAKIPKALFKESLQKQTDIIGKTLVILIGKVIDDEIIFQNQMRHVVKPHHADIAIISDYNNRKNENIYKHFKYVWESFENSDELVDKYIGRSVIYKYLSLCKCENARRCPLFGSMLGHQGDNGGAMSLQIKRYILLKEYFDILNTYDRIILMRPDHYFIRNLPIYDVSNNIFIPWGQDHGGINDRFIIFGRDNIENCLNILDVYKYEDTYNLMIEKKLTAMLENVLLYILQNTGIENKIVRIPQCMCSVLQNDPKYTVDLPFDKRYQYKFKLEIKMCEYNLDKRYI